MRATTHLRFQLSSDCGRELPQLRKPLLYYPDTAEVYTCLGDYLGQGSITADGMLVVTQEFNETGPAVSGRMKT